MKLAPGIPIKDPKQYKIVGTSAPRIDLPPQGDSNIHLHAGCPNSRHAPRPGRASTRRDREADKR
jgi:hypothetical protein